MTLTTETNTLLVSAVQVCTRMFAAIDARDWPQFRRCLAPEVVTDFSALWGAAPQRSSAADLVTQWSVLFAHFHATQHLVAGYTLETEPNPDADGATAGPVLHATFQATHTADDPFGSPTWTLFGTYRLTLTAGSAPLDLQVSGIYQTPTFGIGNRNIVLQAANAT